jgi:hypothetical protein
MHRSSSAAWVLRGVVAALLAGSLACLLLVWDESPMLAAGAALGVALLHAWILGLEFVLMRGVHGDDPAPRPSLAQVMRAWWRETLLALQVFGWRQPFAWRKVDDELGRGSRRGIVFVHGFMCNRGFWFPWLHEARRRDHPFIAINMDPVFGRIEDHAQTIDDAVAQMEAATGRPPVLVCHSMGGLAARAWLQRARPGRVAHIVTIGSPHHGTWVARFSWSDNGAQMRIGSDWILALGSAGPVAAGLFTCWYSNCDNIVFPPSTATLDGADNRFVAGAAHVDLAFRPELMRATYELVQAL